MECIKWSQSSIYGMLLQYMQGFSCGVCFGYFILLSVHSHSCPWSHHRLPFWGSVISFCAYIFLMSLNHTFQSSFIHIYILFTLSTILLKFLDVAICIPNPLLLTVTWDSMVCTTMFYYLLSQRQTPRLPLTPCSNLYSCACFLWTCMRTYLDHIVSSSISKSHCIHISNLTTQWPIAL